MRQRIRLARVFVYPETGVILLTKKSFKFSLVFVATLVAFSLCVAIPNAFASPASKRAQAEAIKAEIDKLDHELELVAEDYNAANEKYLEANKKRKAAETRFDEASAELEKVTKHLNARATNMYRDGNGGFLEVLFGADSFQSFAITWDLLKSMSEDDASAALQLKALKKELAELTKTLVEQEAIAKKENDIMKAKKDSYESQIAERRRKVAGIEAELNAIFEAEARSASAVTKPSSSGTKNYPKPSKPSRSEVVSYAKKFIGVPYRWGGTSPSGFDCSGFTQYVYKNGAGVSLPRTSRSQIGAGQRVSRADLAPGDLVFYGSPISHVGIYIGGGQVIHAPRPGRSVSITGLDNMGKAYVGAARP